VNADARRNRRAFHWAILREKYMRAVKVEAGGRELIFTMQEAKEWVTAGFACWVGRNRLRLTARCDAKPLLHGMSAVFGSRVAEVSNLPWAQTFMRNQFLKRESSATK
jgi:hypothetical protein